MSKKKHKHHRKPRSRGGDNSEKNISLVNRDKHDCWHLLFRNFDPHEIALIVNIVWLDPDAKFIPVNACDYQDAVAALKYLGFYFKES